MIFNPTPIQGAYTIDPEPHEDERGYFARIFCEKELEQAGIPMQAVQISTSYNHKKHTLRGLHSQKPPFSEIKIVRCTRGAIFDVAVDVREDSATFGRYVSAQLTPGNGRMMLVPKGFAHGFITLCDDTDVLYLMSTFYVPQSERGYRYDDPLFNIQWPKAEHLTLSPKDAAWPYVGS